MTNEIFSSIFALISIVFLELALSFDNAVVISMRIQHLPLAQRAKARYYGILGAIVLRGVLLFFTGFILQFSWLKLVGGGYLLWLAIDGLIKQEDEHNSLFNNKPGFISTIIQLELLDLQFSLDNCLAISALAKMPIIDITKGNLLENLAKMFDSPGFWVAIIGTTIGMFGMRFASKVFSYLIDRWPAVEKMAFWAILLIGIKITFAGVIDGLVFYFDKVGLIPVQDITNGHLIDFIVSLLVVLCFVFPVVFTKPKLTENL